VSDLPANVESVAAIDGYVLGEASFDYIANSIRPETAQMYKREFATFARWCEARKIRSLPAPAQAIADYLIGLGDRPRASIQRIRAAISAWHTAYLANVERQTGESQVNPARDQLVTLALKGLYRRTAEEFAKQKKSRRTRRSVPGGGEETIVQRARPPKSVAALPLDDLETLLRLSPSTLRGLRNQVVFAVCWYSGLRRSELVMIDRCDLEFTVEGLIIRLPFFKTDQEGEGDEVAIARQPDREFCPVALLETWIERAAIAEGSSAVFLNFAGSHGRSADRPRRRLSASGVRELLREAGREAGIANADRLGGHSFRRGVGTDLAREGAPIQDIARHLRQRDIRTTMRYLDEANRRAGGPTKIFRKKR
jgi:integrase